MLLGRERERERIEALVAGARLGTSGVLVVTGEPGIGKTALLADVADGLTGMRVLRATGTEAERDLPFAGLGQLLRLSPDDLAATPTRRPPRSASRSHCGRAHRPTGSRWAPRCSACSPGGARNGRWP
jgi:hypothetical protein